MSAGSRHRLPISRQNTLAACDTYIYLACVRPIKICHVRRRHVRQNLIAKAAVCQGNPCICKDLVQLDALDLHRLKIRVNAFPIKTESHMNMNMEIAQEKISTTQEAPMIV